MGGIDDNCTGVGLNALFQFVNIKSPPILFMCVPPRHPASDASGNFGKGLVAWAVNDHMILRSEYGVHKKKNSFLGTCVYQHLILLNATYLLQISFRNDRLPMDSV